MNWKQLVTSPPPSTGWLLDGGTVAAVRWDPKNEVYHSAAESLPQGTCEIGPVGLQVVHRERLSAVINSVHGRVEGGRRVALVVPTRWVRMHLLDFDQLPGRKSEVDQVVLWRLKKLLPVLPSELRVSTVAHSVDGGMRRLVCLVGVERALAGLESAFAEVGVEPGMITPRLFALAGGSRDGPRMVVQQEPGFVSLLLLVDNIPALLRTKPVSEGGLVEDGIRRELQLAERYIRSELEIGGEIAVTVSAESDPVRRVLEDWWSARQNVVVTAARTRPAFVEPAVAERLGDARVDSVIGLIGGAAQ
jgi:hypothetical protein